MKIFGLGMVMLFSSWTLTAQYNLRGKVTSASGEGLPGANVVLRNAGKAAATDQDGQFVLRDIVAGNYALRISFVGFKTAEQAVIIDSDITLEISLQEDVFRGEEVMVYATRAHEKTPTTYSNISNEELETLNAGQDLPYLLRFTPSVVVTSDAGAGVGYTGIRIRGSDATRVNVTVNGIPINDSESHGTFWVNMPDFASSVNNIQIQRGVGTSTNGAAAFGATINLQTSLPSQEAYARLDNSYGSFNTKKHTVVYNTGLLKDRWSFEGRLSQIASDGYIDRAFSDLKSYYLAGGYYGDKTTVKALTFAGSEQTFQSWYGTPEAVLTGDDEDIRELIDFGAEYETPEQLANLMNADRRFNYYLYENETDNYQQDHYQLHLNHRFSEHLNATAALHYTYGRGYYEQYRYDDDLADYSLPEVVVGGATITSTDLIRRRWLDNHFYGMTFSINHSRDLLDFTIGGGANYYDGDHFGEIIWARFASTSEIRERYYENYGRKSDINLYAKTNYQVSTNWNLFLDLQGRTIDYETLGIDSDLRTIDTGGNYFFFNPKAGFTYKIDPESDLYASYAVSNREPVRTDFIDNEDTPRPETLRNVEVGYRRNGDKYALSVNYYLMDYKNQLALTGALNDVGSALRVNVPDSYRTGIELAGVVKPIEYLELAANLTLSQNKIGNFTEVVYDYGENFDEFNVIQHNYRDTDIAFSPNVITSGSVALTPVEGLSLLLLSKYVGAQYLDNTSNEERKIEGYFLSDFKIGYQFGLRTVEKIGISLLVNNIFNKEYASNGYTWGYAYGEGNLYQQNNYYPQAGTNFLAELSLTF